MEAKAKDTNDWRGLSRGRWVILPASSNDTPPFRRGIRQGLDEIVSYPCFYKKRQYGSQENSSFRRKYRPGLVGQVEAAD